MSKQPEMSLWNRVCIRLKFTVAVSLGRTTPRRQGNNKYIRSRWCRLEGRSEKVMYNFCLEQHLQIKAGISTQMKDATEQDCLSKMFITPPKTTTSSRERYSLCLPTSLLSPLTFRNVSRVSLSTHITLNTVMVSLI